MLMMVEQGGDNAGLRRLGLAGSQLDFSIFKVLYKFPIQEFGALIVISLSCSLLMMSLMLLNGSCGSRYLQQ